MCGRFNIINDPLTQLIMQIVGGNVPWTVTTEYNIAPTQMVPVLRHSDEEGWAMPAMRWWLVPYWSPEPSTKYNMFNAKSETLATSRAYKEPFKRRRCVIPASGYYEWKKEGSIKVPYYVEPSSEPGFAFAGLWDRWHRGDLIIESCTIVTAASPEPMKNIHNRIPVHLTVDQARIWANQEAESSRLQELLVPEIRMGIQVTPVSTIVNNARNKDDRCVEPLGETIKIH
jgi:putative SOS response-associated peptidase YedK